MSFQDAFWIELGPTWAPKVPKMTPTWRPKTTPNRPKIDVKKVSKILLDSKTAGVVFWGRPGGMRGGPGGIIGGSKNSAKKVWPYFAKNYG